MLNERCKKNWRFSTNISETIQDVTIVTVEEELELVCDLQNGVISNNVQRPVT